MDEISRGVIDRVTEPLLPGPELLLKRKLQFLRWLYQSGRIDCAVITEDNETLSGGSLSGIKPEG